MWDDICRGKLAQRPRWFPFSPTGTKTPPPSRAVLNEEQLLKITTSHLSETVLSSCSTAAVPRPTIFPLLPTNLSVGGRPMRKTLDPGTQATAVQKRITAPYPGMYTTTAAAAALYSKSSSSSIQISRLRFFSLACFFCFLPVCRGDLLPFFPLPSFLL